MIPYKYYEPHKWNIFPIDVLLMRILQINNRKMANHRPRGNITTNAYLNLLEENIKAPCSAAILNASNAALDTANKMDDLLQLLGTMKGANITNLHISKLRSKSNGILELTLTALRKAEEATEKCITNNIEKVKAAVEMTKLTWNHMNEVFMYINNIYNDIARKKINHNVTVIENMTKMLSYIWKYNALVAYKRWYNLTPAGRKYPMLGAGGRRKRTHRKRKQRTHRR